ncbi:MAG: hypothetical protein H6641_08255 [Caldilineaceae bacterium]|nr:hypothetical protein [Caldilineaceae bacterium]
MTESEYQKWWEYHIRVARGEVLNELEAAIYSAGLDELDRAEAEEMELLSLANLRQLRGQIQQRTSSLGQLMQRNEKFGRQITELEQAYEKLTGYSLLMDSHVSSPT